MSQRGDVTYPQVYEIAESETRAPKLSFLGDLPSGVLLSGTPTVAEIGSSDLTIASVARSTVTMTIQGVSHAASQAVICTVAGASAGRLYRLRVTCGTDGTPAETLVRVFRLRGVGDGS